MKRVNLQPAYVLHRRSYRESSFLIELFTPEHGRLTVVARGARKSRSASPGLLQPFVPLLVSFAGKGELMALSHAEAHGMMRQLRGECLFAGFYLNELLMCLLQKWDSHPGLYAAYENAVAALFDGPLQQKVLRSFEKCLLEEIGYGLLPKSENSLHNTFSPDQFYRFMPEHGFVLCEPGGYRESGRTPDGKRVTQGNIFSGKSLIAIAKDDWQDETCLQDAKRLTRFVLAPLLGSRPIYSRRLFMQLDEEKQNEE
ncbi:DNA repair protein RecO [Aquicella siphonis]|uniref:DNA repair protein RecO n=1 Tax=Aquicella siphonis TaxID=254247 RepID=A0A5E4PHL9_9COXI|nr:DNA repair protein RecO [Aquicella siphonis]VVC75816.1 DNA repair protein RecO [Aquicella siphonis]